MTGPDIVPYFSYRDAAAAIRFLETAFGLHVIQSYAGEDGRVLHAEMGFGHGVIMLGSTDEEPGRQSPGTYLVVEDVDAHFDRAREAGADIVYPPEDTEFGTRRYRARDPEGHEWSFGSYAPSLEPPDWSKA